MDLARLDRQSLGRLEMRAILDRMAGAEGGAEEEGGGGGRNVTVMGRQIRQWIRDKLKEEVSKNGFRQQNTNTTQHRDNKTEEHIRATHGHGAPMPGMVRNGEGKGGGRLGFPARPLGRSGTSPPS